MTILNSKIKKSGKNTFAGFDYYELGDIVPLILESCKKYNVFLQTSFDNEVATLKIINIEAPQEILEYTSPMRELSLKGCNEIQNLGGVETYQRRYLLLMAFDIVEPDLFDGVVGKTETKTINNEEIKKVSEEEITKYIEEKGYFSINGQGIYNYFEKMGWKDKSGQPIKDWRKFIDWMSNNNKNK